MSTKKRVNTANSEADPRDPTTARKFTLDGTGKVASMALVWEQDPLARYACISATVIPEGAAGGNRVVTVEVQRANGSRDAAARVLMIWPYGEPRAPESGVGPGGNMRNEFVTESPFPSVKVGPIGFVIVDDKGNEISDRIWGFGLPDNRHVCGYVIFQERAAEPFVEPEVTDYATLNEALMAEAEASDLLRVNPRAALCKRGAELGFWPTGNEFSVSFGKDEKKKHYVAQRFRDPFSDKVIVLYCVVGDYGAIKALVW